MSEGCVRDVKRVECGLGRRGCRAQQRSGEVLGRGRCGEYHQAGRSFDATLRSARVALADSRPAPRATETTRTLPVRPTTCRDLLVRDPDNVAAGTRGQVAQHRPRGRHAVLLREGWPSLGLPESSAVERPALRSVELLVLGWGRPMRGRPSDRGGGNALARHARVAGARPAYRSRSSRTSPPRHRAITLGNTERLTPTADPRRFARGSPSPPRVRSHRSFPRGWLARSRCCTCGTDRWGRRCRRSCSRSRRSRPTRRTRISSQSLARRYLPTHVRTEPRQLGRSRPRPVLPPRRSPGRSPRRRPLCRHRSAGSQSNRTRARRRGAARSSPNP